MPTPAPLRRTTPRPGVVSALTDAREILARCSAGGFPPFIRWFDALLDRPVRSGFRASGHRGRA